jgi:hypothetical protein
MEQAMRRPKVTAAVGVLTASLLLTAGVASGVGASGAGTAAGGGAPKFDPANFAGARVKNPWFPLKPGTILRYRGVKDGRRGVDVVRVTHRRKTILGVSATVVRDRLYQRGVVREDTTDWYAQDKRGNVWYMGEATRELSVKGKVLNTEGSWQAGVDGARAGIFMPAHPKVGQTFQQEFYPGQAEDHFKILSLNATVRVPAVSSRHSLRTREWTPLEPGVVDNKYYVRGIGTVRELTVKGGNERFALVSIRKP